MRKVEPTGRRPFGITCPNCDKLITVAHPFDSLILCGDCKSIADHLLAKCRKELDKTLDVYKRILVAAAMEKKLHLQNAEATKKTTMHDQV